MFQLASLHPRSKCFPPCSRSRSLIPKSSYYFGPPPPGSAYGSHPVGQIGLHHPREIIRVERDYTGGELIQFAPIYPLELEGRVRHIFACLLHAPLTLVFSDNADSVFRVDELYQRDSHIRA